MNQELIDIRSDEASSCCLRGGLALASMSPTGDTRCRYSLVQSVPRHAVTRPTVMPYLPIDVLTAKGPASTADYKRHGGSKSFSVSKLRWSLLLDFFNIKSNFGMRSENSLSHDRSQGTLHGQQNKIPCGIQWLCRQVPGLMICLRVTHLQILLKSYSLISIDFHPFFRFPYLFGFRALY